MTACNRFGESIVHMACRRADFEVVDFLLENIGDVWGVDDFGRTPLHDACWRPEPRFDIVTCLRKVNEGIARFAWFHLNFCLAPHPAWALLI